MKASTNIKVVVTVEQFSQMSADEIARYIRSNPKTGIVGDTPGEDRHIVKYENINDFLRYGKV